MNEFRAHKNYMQATKQFLSLRLKSHNTQIFFSLRSVLSSSPFFDSESSHFSLSRLPHILPSSSLWNYYLRQIEQKNKHSSKMRITFVDAPSSPPSLALIVNSDVQFLRNLDHEPRLKAIFYHRRMNFIL